MENTSYFLVRYIVANPPIQTVTVNHLSTYLHPTNRPSPMLRCTPPFASFFAERQVLEVQTPVMSQAGNTDIFLQSVSS